jgi:hypothetical protein
LIFEILFKIKTNNYTQNQITIFLFFLNYTNLVTVFGSYKVPVPKSDPILDQILLIEIGTSNPPNWVPTQHW